MKNNTMLLIFGGVVVMLLLTDSVMSQVCPQCKCPTTFKPVCAFQKSTNTYRGFQSECVLRCNNACKRKSQQYEFLGEGRCGRYMHKTTTTTTTTPVPTTARIPSNEVFTTPLPYVNNNV